MGLSSAEYLFTDVVYRSNQAFEGALKKGIVFIPPMNHQQVVVEEIKFYVNETTMRVLLVIQEHNRLLRCVLLL